MQLETLHNILHQGIIDIVRIRIFLAKNLSWLTVQQTFAINSTAPGIVVIKDEQSQYTINKTLQRLDGNNKGSVNITDLPAGEYNVSVFDQSEDTKPAYVHHNHLQVKPPAIISFYLSHTPAVSTASESINSVSNGNLDYILIQ